MDPSFVPMVEQQNGFGGVTNVFQNRIGTFVRHKRTVFLLREAVARQLTKIKKFEFTLTEQSHQKAFH